MKITEKALRDLGYEVVDIEFPQETWEQGRNLLIGMLCNGGAPAMMKDFLNTGEKLLPPIRNTVNVAFANAPTRWLIDTFLSLSNQRRQLTNLKFARLLTPEKFELMLKERYEFAYKFQKYWKDQGVTAMVSPLWPHVCPKEKDVVMQGSMGEYSFLWNVTGYPAGTMPVTRVQEDEQVFEDTYKDSWTKLLNSECEGSAGLPVSVQVIGYSYEDEKLLGIMNQIEK
jgi:Asp-tRNA(Asn)/Glu-tRNA(Gln) amidotransferase A subunit family amidase